MMSAPAHELNRFLAEAKPSATYKVMDRVAARRAAGDRIISLCAGEPDFDTPDNIQQAATAAMKAGLTHYSPVMGIPELRAALSKKLKAENGLDYSANEICLANGA